MSVSGFNTIRKCCTKEKCCKWKKIMNFNGRMKSCIRYLFLHKFLDFFKKDFHPLERGCYLLDCWWYFYVVHRWLVSELSGRTLLNVCIFSRLVFHIPLCYAVPIRKFQIRNDRNLLRKTAISQFQQIIQTSIWCWCFHIRPFS